MLDKTALHGHRTPALHHHHYHKTTTYYRLYSKCITTNIDYYFQILTTMSIRSNEEHVTI